MYRFEYSNSKLQGLDLFRADSSPSVHDIEDSFVPGFEDELPAGKSRVALEVGFPDSFGQGAKESQPRLRRIQRKDGIGYCGTVVAFQRGLDKADKAGLVV